MCLKEIIGQHAQNMSTISDSIVNMMGGGGYMTSTNIFTSRIIYIDIYMSSKNYDAMATTQFGLVIILH